MLFKEDSGNNTTSVSKYSIEYYALTHPHPIQPGLAYVIGC